MSPTEDQQMVERLTTCCSPPSVRGPGPDGDPGPPAYGAKVGLDRWTNPAAASTSVDEALSFAERVVSVCTRTLGQSALGVILHGSLTLGGYIPESSDVDLLLVVDQPLADAQLAALIDALAAAGPHAPVSVDLRVVSRQVAAAPTPTPPMEAYIRIVPDHDLQLECRHPGERDLVVEFSMCRAHGRSLWGLAPAELIGEMPQEWVLKVGDAQLADWEAIGDDPGHAQLTVLTACRIWRFAEEGCHCSKTEAGEWALKRDPALQAVQAALDQRRVDPTISIHPAQVQHLLQVVRARLATIRR